MNQYQKKCFQIPIKNQKQIQQFKRREQNPIQGTPKIIMGKFQKDLQQIWTQQFKIMKTSQLRALKSISKNFQTAILISNAVKQLSKIYGNFILNENMIFRTQSQQIFIWINTDIFVNSPKIFLPKTKEGQIGMIKGIVNNLRLWLNTSHQTLSQIHLIQQLPYKLQQLSKQKPAMLSKANSILTFSNENGIEQMEKRLYESSKGVKLKSVINHDKYSKNSQNSEQKQKCFTNRCFTNKPVSSYRKYKKIEDAQTLSNQNQFSKKSISANQKQLTSSFSKQTSLSFKNIAKSQKQKNFPNKTTSSTLKILQQIKKADHDPNNYTSNKILQYQPQNISSQKEEKFKGPLGGIGEQLDNLFQSNVQSEQQNIEQLQKRQEQFSKLLQF